MDKDYTVIWSDYAGRYADTVILYGKTSDNYLYKDSAFTETKKLSKDELMDLLKHGLVLISYGGAFYRPLFFKESSGSVAVTFATAIGASSTSVTLYSKEYSED